MTRSDSHKENKKLCEYSNEELTIALLKIIGVGILVTAVLVAPNLAQLYKYFNAQNKEERRKLYFKMRALSKGGYVTERGGAYVLSAKGRKELFEDEVWSLVPPQPKAGGGWHVVMYDIPAKKRQGRHALRFRLEELGCKKYQDSVYYHRTDLRSVLAPFTEFYGIRLHVRFLEVKKLDGIDV